MILKAKERGCARQLGAYLLRQAENDRIEVHEVRGFIADDVPGAMQEADALAKGTRCKNHLFSVSLNPPQTESVRVEVFETALAQIEERTGLKGQPRIVVFHEKDGRRHAHAVWSRIDPVAMKAIELPFYKMRLREASKQLYLENGWQMPRGLVDSKARDPRNFDMAEWQQCKQIGRNTADLKAIMQECWASSDSGTTFIKALEERGLYLARGDRRGHVALTYGGEVLSIARYVGKKTKEVSARLGSPDALRSIEDTRRHIASQIAPRLEALMDHARAEHQGRNADLEERRYTMKVQHDLERARLDAGLKARADAENRVRSDRLRKGLLGLWDRATGQYAKLRKQNEFEALMALRRDRNQRHALIQAQLSDRLNLQSLIRAERHRHALKLTELHRDLHRQRQPEIQPSPHHRGRFAKAAENTHQSDRFERPRPRLSERRRDRGCDLER